MLIASNLGALALASYPSSMLTDNLTNSCHSFITVVMPNQNLSGVRSLPILRCTEASTAHILCWHCLLLIHSSHYDWERVNPTWLLTISNASHSCFECPRPAMWALQTGYRWIEEHLTISKAPRMIPQRTLQYINPGYASGSSTKSVKGLSSRICEPQHPLSSQHLGLLKRQTPPQQAGALE